MGVHHFPHPKNKKIKMVSRLVVLPDYQGIGIGYKFLCVIADAYKKQGYDFRIMTSAKNLINKLYQSKEWCMTRTGMGKTNSPTRMVALDKTIRSKCKTASFIYKG